MTKEILKKSKFNTQDKWFWVKIITFIIFMIYFILGMIVFVSIDLKAFYGNEILQGFGLLLVPTAWAFTFNAIESKSKLGWVKAAISICTLGASIGLLCSIPTIILGSFAIIVNIALITYKLLKPNDYPLTISWKID